MSGRGGIANPSALASGKGANWRQILAIVVVGAWATTAVLSHDWLYDLLAVATSIVLLSGAAAFFVWEAPPEREAYRLLGFFVLGQAFISSGLGVLIGEDESTLALAPTTEAFSFAVESAGVFALTFLIGAFLTAPRKVATPPPSDDPSAVGPTEVTALVLATLAALCTVALTTGIGGSLLESLGMIPLVLLNPEFILPLFMASRILTPKKLTLPLIIVFGAQMFSTFLSSMLGTTLLAVRDALLATVFLRKPLPFRWIMPIVVVFVVLNPVKKIFRETAFNGDEALSVADTFELWNDAFTSTWEERPRDPNRPGIDSSVRRLNYNSMSAHVFTMLEGRLPFEEGGTYEDIPTLLVPRFIYPGKPTTIYLRGRWLIRLGLQDEESVTRTAFAVPASAEAYWNFGWPGVFGVGFVLGLVVGLFLRLAPRDPVARTAFMVFSVVMLGQFLDMLIWVIPKFFVVIATAGLLEVYVRLGKRRAAPAVLRTTH